MSATDPTDERAVLGWVRAQVAGGNYLVSDHAQDEMDEEDITLAEIFEAIGRGRILENYPAFFKGPCCLIYGETQRGRPLHVVCSTTGPKLVFITTYSPVPPKWITPTRRGGPR